MTLRSKLIRLAHANPELRSHLLPIIKSAGCEKLPEGGMRDNCEKKKEEGEKKEAKTASEEGSGSKEFGELLSKRFKGVKEKNGSGNVDLGPINIYWDESNNDNAVTVGITFKKQIKGSPKEMFDAVTAILKAIP